MLICDRKYVEWNRKFKGLLGKTGFSEEMCFLSRFVLFHRASRSRVRISFPCHNPFQRWRFVKVELSQPFQPKTDLGLAYLYINDSAPAPAVCREQNIEQPPQRSRFRPLRCEEQKGRAKKGRNENEWLHRLSSQTLRVSQACGS